MILLFVCLHINHFGVELLGKPTIFYSGLIIYFNGDPWIENKVVYGTDGLIRFMDEHLANPIQRKIEQKKVHQYANFNKPTKFVRSVLFSAIEQDLLRFKMFENKSIFDWWYGVIWQCLCPYDVKAICPERNNHLL